MAEPARLPQRSGAPATRVSADAVLAALRRVPGVRDPQLAWGEQAPAQRLVLDQDRLRAEIFAQI